MSSIFDDDYYIPQLRSSSHEFPNPREASEEGLLAFGGDLNPNRILKAYRSGIFPWFNPSDPILWWSPDPRMILYPQKFKTSKSFRRVLRNRGYEIKFDHNFKEVISHCGNILRPNQEGTWLTTEMKEAYIELHDMGFAHSVETYYNGELVGGLYGIVIGKIFCGESMFSHVNDASKSAYAVLVKHLKSWGYEFVDCQVPTDHLISLGAHEVHREYFLMRLESLKMESISHIWKIDKILLENK